MPIARLQAVQLGGNYAGLFDREAHKTLFCGRGGDAEGGLALAKDRELTELAGRIAKAGRILRRWTKARSKLLIVRSSVSSTMRWMTMLIGR